MKHTRSRHLQAIPFSEIDGLSRPMPRRSRSVSGEAVLMTLLMVAFVALAMALVNGWVR